MSAQMVSAWGVSCDGCGIHPDWAALTLRSLRRHRTRMIENGWILEHESLGDRCPPCHRSLVAEGSVPADALDLVDAMQKYSRARTKSMRARNAETLAERERRDLCVVWSGFGF